MAKRKRPSKATKDDSTGKTPETDETVSNSTDAVESDPAKTDPWTADDYDKVPETPDLEANEENVDTDVPEPVAVEASAQDAETPEIAEPEQVQVETTENTATEEQDSETEVPEPAPSSVS
ncbi:MAG: hypothetical protein AAFY75_12965, partial [Pseudomonadota bacterium]